MDAASAPGASPNAAAELKPIVSPSSGVHITLPNYYSPGTMGLLDPSTSDGRVLFFLPWQGNTIAGTTDSPSTVDAEPLPKEEDIRWILEEVRRYLSPDIKVRRGDVLSAWSGIRPLVRDPAAKSTEGLVRNHMINVSDSGLVTIAGGKWTTYRAMAEETVDCAIKTFALGHKAGPCVTERVRLVGSDSWSKNMFIGLIQRVSTRLGSMSLEHRVLTAHVCVVRTRDRGREAPIRQLWGPRICSVRARRADRCDLAFARKADRPCVSL